MDSVTRTIYGDALQTSQMLGIPHNVLQYTTLNERFGVEVNSVLPDNQYPKVRYYGIGTGGMKLVAGADGEPRAEQVQHRATDAACYKPFPFVLRELDNDLSATERQKYALRTIVVYNNTQYVAYYLKRIVMDQVTVSLERKNFNNGVPTTSAFVPSADNLTPTPPVITNQGANILTSDYINCTAELLLDLTEDECQELLDASIVIYGTEDKCILSEFVFCSGYDKVVQLPNSGNFNEAIAVQVVAHVATMHPVKYSTGGITGTYSLGVNEPLLSIA